MIQILLHQSLHLYLPLHESGCPREQDEIYSIGPNEISKNIFFELNMCYRGKANGKKWNEQGKVRNYFQVDICVDMYNFCVICVCRS